MIPISRSENRLGPYSSDRDLTKPIPASRELAEPSSRMGLVSSSQGKSRPIRPRAANPPHPLQRASHRPTDPNLVHAQASHSPRRVARAPTLAHTTVQVDDSVRASPVVHKQRRTAISPTRCMPIGDAPVENYTKQPAAHRLLRFGPRTEPVEPNRRLCSVRLCPQCQAFGLNQLRGSLGTVWGSTPNGPPRRRSRRR